MSALANRTLRAFSLVVTDRRWAAPLSAMALGFGLFIGVAIGPNAAGTLAGTAQVIEVPGSGGNGDGSVKGGDGSQVPTEPAGGALGGDGVSLEAPAPVAPVPLGPPPVAPAPPAEEPAPEPAPRPRAEAPEEEEGEGIELKGVVVHANPAAGSYALAIKGGELVPIHARKLPAPGTKLTVLARRLANGTFAEAEIPERSGKSAQAAFEGVITFVGPDPAAPTYAVSGRGASILVHCEPDPTGAMPQLPTLGAYVTVTAGIEKSEPTTTEPATAVVLRQRQVKVETAEPSTYLDLAGVVTAVLPDTSQLLLSADDSRQSGQDLTLAVPAAIDTSGVEIGDSYLATAEVAEDGTLTLAGLASDEHTRGADDAASAQGDLKR